MATTFLKLAIIALAVLLLALAGGLLMHDLLPAEHAWSIAFCSISLVLPTALPVVRAIAHHAARHVRSLADPFGRYHRRARPSTAGSPLALHSSIILLCTLRC